MSFDCSFHCCIIPFRFCSKVSSVPINHLIFFWEIYIRIMKWWSCCFESSDQLVIPVNYAMKFRSKMWLTTFFVPLPSLLLLVSASFSLGLSAFAWPGSERIKVESWINTFFCFQTKAISWLCNCPHISSSFSYQ